MMPVIMFQPRFAPLVKDGTKRTTIRKVRKRNPIKVNDVLSLRQWSGSRAYEPGSTQIVLRTEKCVRVDPIEIDVNRCKVDTISMSKPWRELIARNDGFATWNELIEWFTNTHGLPFTGELISWSIESTADV